MTKHQKDQLCGIIWLAGALVMLGIIGYLHLDAEFGSVDAGLDYYSERWDAATDRFVDKYAGAIWVVMRTLGRIVAFAGLFVVVRETTKVLVSKTRTIAAIRNSPPRP